MGWTNVVVFVGRIATPISYYENGNKSCFLFTVYSPKYLPKLELGEIVPVPDCVKIECVAYGEAMELVKKWRITTGDVISVEGSIQNIKKIDLPTKKTYTSLAICVKNFTLLVKTKKRRRKKNGKN